MEGTFFTFPPSSIFPLLRLTDSPFSFFYLPFFNLGLSNNNNSQHPPPPPPPLSNHIQKAFVVSPPQLLFDFSLEAFVKSDVLPFPTKKLFWCACFLAGPQAPRCFVIRRPHFQTRFCCALLPRLPFFFFFFFYYIFSKADPSLTLNYGSAPPLLV